MKVLFVCSGNQGLSPIVQAQTISLQNAGVSVDIHMIIGKGLVGYLGAIPRLKRAIKKHNPDLVHAHYSLCGIVSYLATSKPIVTSLMGSDVNQSGLLKAVTKFFIRHSWEKTIVKSIDMKEKINSKDIVVLPNGVNLDLFRPMDKSLCRRKVGWKDDTRIVLFAADPKRPEKNYPLADHAIELCEMEKVELKVVFGISPNDIPYYLNACDLLLLTSLWEGSPNIIKEAMACNVPVVSTPVGDVEWLFGGREGLSIASPTASDIADKVSNLLGAKTLSDGRARIIDLGLNSKQIAQKLVQVYSNLLTTSRK